MFRRNILLVIGIAALLAGLALSALWFGQSSAPKAGSATESSTIKTSILVASHPMMAGYLLRPEDMAWKDIAPTDVAAGNIVRGSAAEVDFVGAVTRRNFGDQEALDADALVKAKDRDFLSAVLSPGYRAVSILVDIAQADAGLITPGDRVDIILTQNLSSQEGDAAHKSVGETILYDRRVIAVDARLPVSSKPTVLDQHIDTQNASGPRTVTLELTARESELILVAIQIGKVAISVRALEGAGMAAARPEEILPVWASDVSPALRSLEQAPQKSAAAVDSPQKPHVLIEVIRGDKAEHP